MGLGAFYSTRPSSGHLLDGRFPGGNVHNTEASRFLGFSRWPLRISRYAHQEECLYVHDFDWLAPVPQPFTRSDARVFWPSDRRSRPLLLATRITRDLKMLIERMPLELRGILRERFKPTRGPLIWETPPALPTSIREGYAPERLKEGTDGFVRSEITVTAELIERLLNAPEGMVGGLTHNYLFAMQVARLRQLWQEVQRRAWPEAPLVVFTRALG